MRRSSIIVALLAANGLAHPADRRASIDVGVGVATNAINTFENTANTIINQIETYAQQIQGSGAASGSAQLQIIAGLDSLSAAAGTLQGAVSSGLSAAGSAGAVAQSDLDALTAAVKSLQSSATRLQSAAGSAIVNAGSKTAAQVAAINDDFNRVLSSLAGATASLQTFANGVTTDANGSKQALMASISSLGNQIAGILKSVAVAFGVGAGIDVSALTGANDSFAATALTNLVNSFFAALNAAIRQAASGGSQLSLSLPANVPGITVQPATFTIPGFTVNPTGVATGSTVPTRSVSDPVQTISAHTVGPTFANPTLRPTLTTMTSPTSVVAPLPTPAPVNNGGGEVITLSLPFFTVTLTIPAIGLPQATNRVGTGAGGVGGGTGAGLGAGVGLGLGLGAGLNLGQGGLIHV